MSAVLCAIDLSAYLVNLRDVVFLTRRQNIIIVHNVVFIRRG